MAFNGQTKTTKVSSQNYTNILYSDSDSDSVPDLKLPPVKGKKFKRRKGPSGKHADPLCNFWTVLKLITAVVIFLVLAILSAACFWTFRQIRELQEHVAAYDNSDKVAAEMSKLQSQLSEVNASLMDAKAGLGSLPQITTTLVDVQKKVEELENANKEIQEHYDASNILPQKVQMLSESLITMGSDIHHMQDTSLLKSVELEKRLTELEIEVKNKNTSTGRAENKQEAFNESLDSGLRQVLDDQSARLKVLEDFTNSSNLKPVQDSTWVTELVTELLEEKVSNLTSGAQSGVNTTKALLAPSSVDNGKFMAFSADIVDNLKQINETLDTLSYELDAVSSRLDSHERALVDLSVVVRSIKTAGVSHPPEHTEVTASVSPTSSSSWWTSQSTSLYSSSLQGESLTESNKSGAVLHIEGINTREDLHKAFQSDWPLENGELDMDMITDLEPSGLDKDKLMQYDADGNGHYSEDEMAVALGFHHNPR